MYEVEIKWRKGGKNSTGTYRVRCKKILSVNSEELGIDDAEENKEWTGVKDRTAAFPPSICPILQRLASSPHVRTVGTS